MTTTAMPAPANSLEDGLKAFLAVRPRLFQIAYRILRSTAEADDIVQDAWLRWQMTDRTIVRDVAAFLATTTTRLAINVRHSARSRHESPLGVAWPELPDSGADQSRRAERVEALAAARNILATSLSPKARAAFVLREAFEYAYGDIARVLGLREANARQIVIRARRRLACVARRDGAAPCGHGHTSGGWIVAAVCRPSREAIVTSAASESARILRIK